MELVYTALAALIAERYLSRNYMKLLHRRNSGQQWTLHKMQVK